MSESEDDNYEMCGTLLEPYDEDTIPKKKAFSVEDQIATDDQGRRRFHGAFTGGFSAGFFNTVGSLEGWTPTEFKSSRSEKANKRLQKPEDFMDDEDQGTFGIAPKVLKATSDYSSKTKRKRVMHEGPIPGDPVLYTLLQPVKESVGIRLLKRMGWKQGQGVGPRLTKSEKLKAKREHRKNAGKIYGCEVPEHFRNNVSSDSESNSSTDCEITFAPDDYDAFIYKPKDNAFGMGYVGLDKRTVLGTHISLIDPPKFRIQEHNNKKMSISGQAFGVGAFENEDEDIYSYDDMSKYDFELGSLSNKKKISKKIENVPKVNDILEGFVISKNKIPQKKVYPPPVLPKGFTAKHGVRISRFEPLPESHKHFEKTRKTERHHLTASDRSRIINSENIIITNTSEAHKNTENKVGSDQIKQMTVIKEENKKILEQAKKITESTKPATGVFQPFISDPDKQSRYETFLELLKQGKRDKFVDVQPISMSDWEKEHERNEFEQASRLYKPVIGLVFDKFVSSSNSAEDVDPLKSVSKSIYEHGTPEMQEAAKMKMFGPLTRVTLPWKPHKLLSRRFNVPEPNISGELSVTTSKRKNKFNIFDYYEAYQQGKTQQTQEIKENTVKSSTDKKTAEEQQSNFCSKNIEKQDSTIGIESSGTVQTTTDNENISKDNLIMTTSNFGINTKNSDSDNHFSKGQVRKDLAEENCVLQSSNILVPQIRDNSESITNKEIPRIKDMETTIVKTKNKIQKSEVKSVENETLSVPIDPVAKKDMFRAIFLSSSESESDDEEKEVDKEKDKLVEMKKIVMEDITVKTEPNKVHRPVTKGFFADLDLSKINKPIENKEKDTQKELDDNFYGPRLPAKEIVDNNLKSWKPTFNKPGESAKKSVECRDEEEWIEADSKKHKKNKSHKKHKKHKQKEKIKKHKSKHKKKKHSDLD